VDKQHQLESVFVELEAANSKGNSRQLFQIVKSMTRKFQPRLQCIQSATEQLINDVRRAIKEIASINLVVSIRPQSYPWQLSQEIEAAQIADRWKGYCEDLHLDEEGKGIEQEYWEQEPPPLCSEVARAIRQTASRKVTGPDEVPTELLKAGGETVLDKMHRICVAIWETGEWPDSSPH